MYTQKTLETAFFCDEKTFKMKQLYNSHNDVVYVLKKMRKSGGARRKIILQN